MLHSVLSLGSGALLLAVCALCIPPGCSVADPRDGTITLRLAAEAFVGGPRVEVLRAEPPLAAGVAQHRLRYARYAAPFVSVARGEGAGEIVLGGVPAGDVVVVVTWPRGDRGGGPAEGAARVEDWALVWRAVEVRAGAVHRLGALPVARGWTEVEQALLEDGARGAADVSVLATCRPVWLPVEVVPRAPNGSVVPRVRFDAPLGGRLRVRGVDRGTVSAERSVGPEVLATGWVMGPESRRASRYGLCIERRVARGIACTLALSGAPVGTEEVRLWARREDGVGPWFTTTVEGAIRDVASDSSTSEAVFEGELCLTRAVWSVLAQAVDGKGRPTGATSLFELDVGAVTDEVAPAFARALAPAASVIVRGERGEAGVYVGVRLAGWTVDLDAGALSREGVLRLEGLVASAPHELVVGERARRLNTTSARHLQEVRLR